MKKVMFVFGMFASVVLVSCGSESGKRTPGKVMRVRSVETREINFVRLSEVQEKVFREGDTVRINTVNHQIVSGIEYVKSPSSFVETVILEK